MTVPRKVVLRISAIAGAATLVIAGSIHAPASPLAASAELAPHRAIYELKLAHSRGNTAVSARGRILYDFSGNACEGFTLQFRQVSELDNGEGKTTLSDLRTTTWEDGAANKLVFKSQNFLNQSAGEIVDGEAARQSDKIAVTLNKPRRKSLELEAKVVFPTDHMRRVIIAARERKTILELPVYDGSETGEKVYNTLTIIGQEISPSERVPTDAAAGQQALATLKRWPVTVSYFEQAARNTGEQRPIYSINFELYENGVSRALLLDYNDFSISGELTSLDLKEAKPCK